MQFNFTSNLQKAFNLIILCFLAFTYLSCQKQTDPAPYSNPPVSQETTLKNAAFSAEVNGSSIINFAPTKTISGGNVSLIGTSAYYTITVTFQKTAGPGSYFNNSPGFVSASIYDGINTYITNASKGSGIFNIDSIPKGRYYGNINFTGLDAASNTESSIGNFSDL